MGIKNNYVLLDVSVEDCDSLAMDDTFLKNLSPENAAIIFAVLIYVTKEFVKFIQQYILKNADKTEKNTQAVQALSLKIDHLSEKMLRLEKSLDNYNDIQAIVWKLEKDVGFAFEKIRDIRDERGN